MTLHATLSNANILVEPRSGLAQTFSEHSLKFKNDVTAVMIFPNTLVL